MNGRFENVVEEAKEHQICMSVFGEVHFPDQHSIFYDFQQARKSVNIKGIPRSIENNQT